jgi:hypothetical protein
VPRIPRLQFKIGFVAIREAEQGRGRGWRFDVRHGFNANAIYDLPFGRGRAFLNGPGILRPTVYLRNRYFGLYAQDSWRVRNDLTINAGLRWDVIMPWWEKFNQLQTYIPGAQSTLYPGAPPGLVVAGGPGVPKTLTPIDDKNFLHENRTCLFPTLRTGTLEQISGSNGQSSIRASYGLFYTAFQGLSAGIMYAVPPFGFNYLSPGPPLLAQPFITAATGANHGQRFPFPFPSHSVSASNPDTSVNWANFLPLAADPFFNHNNRPAYTSNYMLSIQWQITRDTLLTVSYVGNQGLPPCSCLSQSRQSCSLPESSRLRALRRGLTLYQQRRANHPGNPRRAGTGLRGEYFR